MYKIVGDPRDPCAQESKTVVAKEYHGYHNEHPENKSVNTGDNSPEQSMFGLLEQQSNLSTIHQSRLSTLRSAQRLLRGKELWDHKRAL